MLSPVMRAKAVFVCIYLFIYLFNYLFVYLSGPYQTPNLQRADPSLPDASYGTTNYCIVLKKILFNQLPQVQNLGGICPPCLTLATALPVEGGRNTNREKCRIDSVRFCNYFKQDNKLLLGLGGTEVEFSASFLLFFCLCHT